MFNKNKELRMIPKKNYLYLVIIILLSFALMYYLYSWYQTYEENKLSTPIMNKYLSEIKYEELDNYITEHQDVTIYTSIIDNENIRSFEKEFKNIVKEYSLRDKIIFLNINDQLFNKNLKNELVNKYNLNNQNITNVPNILIIKNGKVTDIYRINPNNYNETNLINYLRTKEIIEGV